MITWKPSKIVTNNLLRHRSRHLTPPWPLSCERRPTEPDRWKDPSPTSRPTPPAKSPPSLPPTKPSSLRQTSPGFSSHLPPRVTAWGTAAPTVKPAMGSGLNSRRPAWASTTRSRTRRSGNGAASASAARRRTTAASARPAATTKVIRSAKSAVVNVWQRKSHAR